MGIGNFFKSIFSGSGSSTSPAPAPSEPLEYKGFSIEAAPLDAVSYTHLTLPTTPYV